MNSVPSMIPNTGMYLKENTMLVDVVVVVDAFGRLLSPRELLLVIPCSFNSAIVLQREV